MVGWHHHLDGHEFEQFQESVFSNHHFKGRVYADVSVQSHSACHRAGALCIFSSVTQLCLTLCDPMNCSTPGLLSITNSWSLLRLMSIESVMPSSHLILCRPLLLPSNFPSIRVFSKESVLHIRWPKCWSFSFSISPSNEYSGLSSL